MNANGLGPDRYKKTEFIISYYYYVPLGHMDIPSAKVVAKFTRTNQPLEDGSAKDERVLTPQAFSQHHALVREIYIGKPSLHPNTNWIENGS
jgi:hypothetical protein